MILRVTPVCMLCVAAFVVSAVGSPPVSDKLVRGVIERVEGDSIVLKGVVSRASTRPASRMLPVDPTSVVVLVTTGVRLGVSTRPGHYEELKCGQQDRK